ncbi:MAG: hypothetical protein E7665_08095 [Ruminococcaceae bacterium]|nr:hypothetical protein [Oscillospiraceae bacterium]
MLNIFWVRYEFVLYPFYYSLLPFLVIQVEDPLDTLPIQVVLMFITQLIFLLVFKRKAIKMIPIYYLTAQLLLTLIPAFTPRLFSPAVALLFGFFSAGQAIGIALAWGVYYLVGSIKKKRKEADVCIAGETNGTTESL